MFKTTWSWGCFVDVILHVSSSTQHELVIFIIEISDSETIIKNGFLKAENVFIRIWIDIKIPQLLINLVTPSNTHQNCLDYTAISFHHYAFSCHQRRQIYRTHCNIKGTPCSFLIHIQTLADNRATWLLNP